MPSALSRLASRARGLFNRRRSPTGGGTTPSQSAVRTDLDRLSRQQQRVPTPPPVQPEQYLRQLEYLARITGLNRKVIEELYEPGPPGVPPRLRQGVEGQVTPPPIEPIRPIEPITPVPPLGETPRQPAASPPEATPPPATQTEPTGRGAAEDEAYDEIETLGRDFGYYEEDFEQMMEESVKVASSNVYSYFYQPESNYSGILYVTFLAPAPAGQQRKGPGPTYAYYSVSRAKYRAFREGANSSPGGAVWDHLRVRGTIFGHQVQYRLIAVSGDYVPRKATQGGYRERMLPPLGTPSSRRGRLPRDPAERQAELARRGFRRSTLPEQLFDARPDRGEPDRGYPNR